MASQGSHAVTNERIVLLLQEVKAELADSKKCRRADLLSSRYSAASPTPCEVVAA